MTAEELKAALLDSFWGTERGLTAASETRAEINELITQLEAVNPCDSPTEAVEKLGGTWKLIYTSNSELMGLLALGKLPLLSIEDITQTIDPLAATIVNSLGISVPFSRTALSTTASLTVQSPKRVNLRFEKGTISTPQLLTDVELPDSTLVMGQSVDLRPVKMALEPVRNASRGVVAQVANLISQQPDLNIPLRNQAQTWLLTTYLDDDLRISRGDAGSVFVLVKEAVPGGAAPLSAPVAIVPLTEDVEEAGVDVQRLEAASTPPASAGVLVPTPPEADAAITPAASKPAGSPDATASVESAYEQMTDPKLDPAEGDRK